MKNLLFSILTSIALISCSNDAQNNDTLPFVQVNKTINLELPEFIKLTTPTGWAYVNGVGLRGIIVYNINGTDFKAFERAAPHLPLKDCSQMVIENGIRMKCLCDDSEFNILNGASFTEGITESAREYLVTNLNGVVLRISNF